MDREPAPRRPAALDVAALRDRALEQAALGNYEMARLLRALADEAEGGGAPDRPPARAASLARRPASA